MRKVRVKPKSYQPRRAELREDVRINAKPKVLARKALRQVKLVEDPGA